MSCYLNMAHWENVFWYQQAPSHDNTHLENNTTASFLTTLRHSEPELTVRVCNAIDPTLIQQPITEIDEIQYEPQPTDEVEPDPEKSMLIGIDGSGQLSPSTVVSATPSNSGGRPDGKLVFRTGGTVVSIILEVKTDEELDASQLKRYKEKYDVRQNDITIGTWRDVHRALVEFQESRTPKSKSQFLIEQFREYLELIQFSPYVARAETDAEKAIKLEQDGGSYHIKFEWIESSDGDITTKSDSKPLSEQELDALLSPIDKQYRRRAFVEGDLRELLEWYEQEHDQPLSGRDTIATVPSEDNADHTKILRLYDDGMIEFPVYYPNGGNTQSATSLDTEVYAKLVEKLPDQVLKEVFLNANIGALWEYHFYGAKAE